MAPLKMIGCSVAIGGTAAGFEVALSFARPALSEGPGRAFTHPREHGLGCPRPRPGHPAASGIPPQSAGDGGPDFVALTPSRHLLLRHHRRPRQAQGQDRVEAPALCLELASRRARCAHAHALHASSKRRMTCVLRWRVAIALCIFHERKLVCKKGDSPRDSLSCVSRYRSEVCRCGVWTERTWWGAGRRAHTHALHLPRRSRAL